MGDNSKKPGIRFKGFTDDWEQRKFSELYVKSNEKNDGSIGMDKNITVATMQFKEDVKVSTDEYLKTYYTFNIGDIAFEGHQSKEFRYGRFVENYIGNGIVSHIFVVFRPIQEYDLHFWKYAINNEILMQRILSKSTKASTMMHDLVTNDFLNETSLVPPLDEQKKVGDFLDNLDHLITLHQRKYDKLVVIKKSMLEKMFPKNGQTKPEIRFSGFTDDWEQRKLGEIATETYGGGTPKTSNEEFWKGDIPWIQSSDLIDECLFDVRPRKCISQEAVSKSATKLVPQNSIAIVTRVGVGKLAFMPFSYATSQDFLSLSGLKIDPEFTVYALFKMMQSVSNEVQGTSIKGVTKDELLAKKIIFPSCNEQKKIGAYLHNLDHLITLHQRELEKLKKIKLSMLEKMFV